MGTWPRQAHAQNASDQNGVQSHTRAMACLQGGGVLRGMGEQCATNPVTGTSPGRAACGPPCSLADDSRAGNGPFSFGWSRRLSPITRKTDTGLLVHCTHDLYAHTR
jgi:Salmonella virulence plasmid 65kDa B protein